MKLNILRAVPKRFSAVKRSLTLFLSRFSNLPLSPSVPRHFNDTVASSFIREHVRDVGVTLSSFVARRGVLIHAEEENNSSNPVNNDATLESSFIRPLLSFVSGYTPFARRKFNINNTDTLHISPRKVTFKKNIFHFINIVIVILRSSRLFQPMKNQCR